MPRLFLATIIALMPTAAMAQIPVDELYDRVEHHYADNDGVRIHYVTAGEGPLVLFVHGFPDQW